MEDFWRKQGQHLRSFLHSRDALVYLLFVVLATIIWFVHAFSSRRTVELTVPVAYIHLPDDYVFTRPPADHLHITLEDEGADIFHYRKRDLQIMFDATDWAEGEEGTFTISPDEIRQAIQQQMPGDASLQGFEPEQISCTYVRQHEKSVPVAYSGHIFPAMQHQLCGDVVLDPCSVHVYGTDEALRAISVIETALTDYEGVQDTFMTTLPLICPQGLRIVPDSVRLSMVAELFTEKALNLTILTPETGDSTLTLHLFPNQVQATFRIGTAWFNSVCDTDIVAFVVLPQTPTDRLPVQVRCLNPHITRVRVKPEEVEYLIEKVKEEDTLDKQKN